MRDLDEIVSYIESRWAITPTQGQAKAYASVESGQPTLIIGTAGSGKSTLQEWIRADFGYETIFCSTTGVSNAMLFNGKGGSGTFHTVCSLPTTLYTEEHVRKPSSYTRKLLAQSDAVKRISVDECGMTSSDSFALYEERIRRFNQPGKNREKRDIQTIFSGDFLQIPSITDRKTYRQVMERYGTTFFFKTREFERMGFNIVYLDQTKRTSNIEFKDMLDVMRFGVESRFAEVCDYFNEYLDPSATHLPTLALTNAKVTESNMKALNANPNPCALYEAKVSGKYDIKDCPAEENLYIKVGLPVITLVNDKEGRYFNGSMGTVVELTEDGPMIQFFNTGETHLVEYFEFSNNESFVVDKVLDDETGKEKDVLESKVIGTVTQIPIKLATSRTIHRAQGLTIDNPTAIDLGVGFSPNRDFGTALAYVGFSRFTNPDYIRLLNRMTPRHIKYCKETIAWLESIGVDTMK